MGKTVCEKHWQAFEGACPYCEPEVLYLDMGAAKEAVKRFYATQVAAMQGIYGVPARHYQTLAVDAETLEASKSPLVEPCRAEPIPDPDGD